MTPADDALASPHGLQDPARPRGFPELALCRSISALCRVCVARRPLLDFVSIESPRRLLVSSDNGVEDSSERSPSLVYFFTSFTCTFCFLRPSTTDRFSAPNPCGPFAITPVPSRYSFDLGASLRFSPLTDSRSSRCRQSLQSPPLHHAPLVVFYILVRLYRCSVLLLVRIHLGAPKVQSPLFASRPFPPW